VDEAQGSELRGREIRLGTRSRLVSASGSVRHTIRRRLTDGPLRSEQPTEIFCRRFDYDPATHVAHYRENAVLRTGSDEIRAAEIELAEPAEGRRRLLAKGGVASVLHPRPEQGAQKPPAPIEVRAQRMVYEQEARRVIYTGEVVIRQADMVTRSPKAEALLSADGSTVERVLAGSPVELQQGQKRARGEQATYTPRDQTLVLVGDEVVLREADRRVSGRTLTFQAGSDRILIDGRDEVRSEAVFHRREPGKP
jgi:lipopolysaccharide transport protein LptA